MSADNDLLGLAIAIYGTLLALLVWLVHAFRSTPHSRLHASPRVQKNGGRR